MGFRLTKTDKRLTWPSDHEFHGLEVVISRSHSISDLLPDEEDVARDPEGRPIVKNADVRKQYRKFGDERLLSWNYLEEDGSTVVPISGDSFLEIPAEIAVGIMKAANSEVFEDVVPLSQSGSSPEPTPILEAG